MEKTIYISKELVSHEELSELDFDLQDSFNFDYDNMDDFIEIDEIKDETLRKGHFVDTSPIDILVLEKLIFDVKKKGGTHLQIAHHSDHNGYEISGFKISLADKLLIKRYKDELRKKNELYSEMNRLNLELNSCRSKLNDLKI